MIYLSHMGGLRIPGQVAQLSRGRSRRIRAAEGYGFTIVEVMVVLAVTGALFIAAAILISGKQNQAGFNSAIQQIQSQVQQIMNEVAAGYFPNSASFQCSQGSPGTTPTLSSVSPNGQGANAGCVFVGKVVQFQVHGTTPEQFRTYTIAGGQKDSTGKEVQSLAAATPILVAPGSSPPSPSYPDLTTSDILQNGLTTSITPPAGMWYNDGAADVNVGAVAFVTSFATYGGVGGTISSGSQKVSVVPVDGTTLGMTSPALVDAVNASLTASPADPSNGVSICFASGGTNESGLLTIGGGGKPLAVTTKIYDGSQTCGR
jgi:type II secretory pathway pseudopilin PulG